MTRCIAMNDWRSLTRTERPCRRSLQEGRKRRHKASLNCLCLPHGSLQGRGNQPSLLDLAYQGHLPRWCCRTWEPSWVSPRQVFPPGGHKALNGTKDPPSKEEADLSSEQEGTQKSSNSRKEYREPRRSSRRRTTQALSWPKHNKAGKQSESGRKPPETPGLGKESKA